ncbi:MAG: hypothetical protein R3F39_15150 [Myxococcota bacterium]
MNPNLLRWCVVPALVFLALPAWSAEIPCDPADKVPCVIQVDDVQVARVPGVFKFQARVSQAKLPVGKGEFATVFAKITSGGEVLCEEKFSNVIIEDSVLNLTIGQNISCALQEVIAENDNLSFEICLGSSSSCLKEVALSSTPYAVKSSFAVMAQRAHKASIAATAYYSQRLTADRDLHLRKKLGTGYFDFYTPATGANPLDATNAAADDGWVQWTPIRDTTAKKLHVAGKVHLSDKVEFLDELIFHATTTRALGGLNVTGATTLEGAALAKSTLFVEGWTFLNSGHADATLVVKPGVGGAKIEGAKAIQLSAPSAISVDNTTANAADLLVGGINSPAGADPASSGALWLQRGAPGWVQVDSPLQARQNVTVDGTTRFNGNVTFGPGATITLPSGPGTTTTASDPDAVHFGTNSSTTKVTLAGDLDVRNLTLAGDATFPAGKTTTFNSTVRFLGPVQWSPTPQFVLPTDTRDLTFSGTLTLGGALTGGEGAALRGAKGYLQSFGFETFGGLKIDGNSVTSTGLLKLNPTNGQTVQVGAGGLELLGYTTFRKHGVFRVPAKTDTGMYVQVEPDGEFTAFTPQGISKSAGDGVLRLAGATAVRVTGELQIEGRTRMTSCPAGFTARVATGWGVSWVICERLCPANTPSCNANYPRAATICNRDGAHLCDMGDWYALKNFANYALPGPTGAVNATSIWIGDKVGDDTAICSNNVGQDTNFDGTCTQTDVRGYSCCITAVQ